MVIKAIDKKVAVIGGGIAGVACAIELVNAGAEVNLVEKEHSLGGFAIRYGCKASGVCNKCSACIVNLKMNDLQMQNGIIILTGCEVIESSENEGKFDVKIKKTPRYVSLEKCISCGLCKEVCPVNGSAIRIVHQQSLPKAYFIDEGLCLRFKGEKCNLCEKVCPAKAVNYSEKEEIFGVGADSVVVACGFSPFDAKKRIQYRYGVFQNVITGINLEEQLRFKDGIRRPSDNAIPKKVAFIQCVGSRDINIGNDYCSQVCCLYAMRMAKVLKNESPEISVSIFYMDLQNLSKEASLFYEKCLKEINFVRAMPGDVGEREDKSIVINYEDIEKGEDRQEEFDLVVLSIGITPAESIKKIGKIFGLKTGESGFFQTSDPCDFTLTDKPNVFIAGACQGPKNIPASIAQGIAAAENVLINVKCKNPNVQNGF